MSEALSPDWLGWPQTQELARAFEPNSLRFVGGAVRDAILSRAVQDVDAATIFPPERTQEVLTQAGIRAVPTGLAHGTVTALVDGRSFEITTLRRDVATDGRHAEVAFTASWQEDAQRRDFTMNALYLSPQGTLYDYTGGAADARAGRVRFIGEPERRIAEDYLRILRFFRFHAWYGVVAPETQALEACRAQAEKLAGLSGERVQKEMLKLLGAPRSGEALRLMQETGVLAVVLGAGLTHTGAPEALRRIGESQELNLPASACLAALLLSADRPPETLLGAIGKRWRLSHEQRRGTESLLRHYPLFSPGQDDKRLLREMGKDAYVQLAAVAWALGRWPDVPDAQWQAQIRRAQAWQPPVFPVNGLDIQRAGVPQGEMVGQTLRQLETLWEKSDYTLTRQQLLAHLQGLLKEE